MSGSRPSIFSDTDVDLTGFTPKSGPAPAPVPPATVRRIADESGFPSRAPVSTPAPIERPAKTGRTVLLNARITQGAHDRFHQIVETERARYLRRRDHAQAHARRDCRAGAAGARARTGRAGDPMKDRPAWKVGDVIDDRPLVPCSQHQIASSRREPDDLACSMNNRSISPEAITSAPGQTASFLKT